LKTIGKSDNIILRMGTIFWKRTTCFNVRTRCGARKVFWALWREWKLWIVDTH